MLGPVTTRYPLAELATLRGTRAQATALELGAALAAETRAVAAVEAARARRAAWVAAARAVTLLDGEPLVAAAVVRRAAYALRLRRDVERAAADLAARQAELVRAQAVVAEARGQVVDARGEREVVERHRERWTDDRRRARERADEP